MPRGRPAASITLAAADKHHLLGIARSRPLTLAAVQGAQIVFACAASEPNAAIAKRLVPKSSDFAHLFPGYD